MSFEQRDAKDLHGNRRLRTNPHGGIPRMVEQALNQNNLGARVVTRTYSWLDAVIRSWGSQFYEPDHRIYEFRSQNYDSTDMNNTGIYNDDL